jgi:hypothetical protein
LAEPKLVDNYFLQAGKDHLKLIQSTPSLRLSNHKPVLMRVEGNCCWTIHARRKFKVSSLCFNFHISYFYFSILQGFKTFVQSQGELNLPSKLIRSIASTECSKMPQMHFAGVGWVAVVVVGVAVLLLSTVFITYKKSQHKNYFESNLSDAFEMNDVEVNVDHEKFIEETQDISCSESSSIMQNSNENNKI